MEAGREGGERGIRRKRGRDKEGRREGERGIRREGDEGK